MIKYARNQRNNYGNGRNIHVGIFPDSSFTSDRASTRVTSNTCTWRKNACHVHVYDVAKISSINILTQCLHFIILVLRVTVL